MSWLQFDAAQSDNYGPGQGGSSVNYGGVYGVPSCRRNDELLINQRCVRDCGLLQRQSCGRPSSSSSGSLLGGGDVATITPSSLTPANPPMRRVRPMSVSYLRWVLLLLLVIVIAIFIVKS